MQGQDTTPSPAPSRSGPNRGPDATATALAAQRAEADAASASQAEKSQDAVMGNLSSIDFTVQFREAAKQMKIDLDSKSDQIPISKLRSLLKVMATGATKQVEDVTDLLGASMTTTAEANKAVVTSLNTVAVWNEKERLRLIDAVALAKGNSANFSISEKLFLAAEAAFHAANKIIFNPNYLKCFPGDSTDAATDEYQQEILLQIDNPSETEEKFGKQVDKRILVNKRKLETVRLKLAKAINSACSANKMEKEKYASFPLDKFLECHTQKAWIAVINAWITKPAVLEKYLEIAHDIVFYCNAYDVNAGLYGKSGLGMLAPVMWSATQKLADPAGFLRSERSETLYNEIEALGVTYSKASAASKKGVKTGLDGKTSILPIKGDGIRRAHLLLLSLGCTRSKDLRENRDMLRLLHEKFTGDARLETAIQETKEQLEAAALLGVAPQWEDVGKPIQTAVEHNCSYFYAKAATEFSDGKILSGGDMQDCTATLIMLFTELDERIAESTRNDPLPKDNSTRSKGKSLEAMQATLGDKTVKSSSYKALSAGNKTKLAAFMAEHSNADAGSNKWQRRCHALSLQIAEGVSLSLPDDKQEV